LKTTSLWWLIETIGSSAKDAIVYPNPYRASRGDENLVISNLPLNSEVSLCTVAGDLVYGPITVGGGQIEIDPTQLGWASGVYLLVVKSPSSGEYVGKIAIIK